MAHQTEAACLLETGALYPKRVLLTCASGDPIFAGWKQAAYSLYFGDAPIYHFDPDGRWQRAFIAGIHYLKGLDATVQAIDRVREGDNLVLKRRTLSFAEATDLDAAVRSAALDLLDSCGSGRFQRINPPAKAQPLTDLELHGFLESVAEWDSARWFAHREKFLETYGPWPILPPDCQNPLVLQATLGHAGGVAFAGAPAAEHYVRSGAEFAEHVSAAARLWGRRTLQCKEVFLGGSDVLLQPTDLVVGYLTTVEQAFPTGAGETADPIHAAGLRLEGIHTFLDDFSRPLPASEDCRRFAARGLRRVTLGVESGDPRVRALYGKTWDNAGLQRIASDLKAAELGVGIMLLVGAGGVEHAKAHLEATLELIASLPLGPGDLVSLLDANYLSGLGSAESADARCFTRLVGPAWIEQQLALRQRLAPLRARTGAKIVPYNLEKQAVS